ncbi:MAG: hypothetical protein ACO398_05905, partial [Kiritimatiellia bacterium]
MNFRKNSVLIMGGGIAVLLFVAALVFLIISRGDYLKNRDALDSVRRKLDQLNQRNPFPSQENVELAKQNLSTLNDKYTALRDQLEGAQLPAEAIEPARFAPMLESAISSVLDRANEAGITTPETVGMGFKEYAEGKLPPNDPRVLARLVVQVRALEHILDAAFDSGISSIDALQRDNFELRDEPQPEPDPRETRRSRGRRGAEPVRQKVAPRSYVPGVPMPPQNPEFEVERFVIGLSGREYAIWGFINTLLKSEIIYSIADISLENLSRDKLGKPVDMTAKLTGLQNAARSAAQARPDQGLSLMPEPELDWTDLSKEQRYVGGRDL